MIQIIIMAWGRDWITNSSKLSKQSLKSCQMTFGSRRRSHCLPTLHTFGHMFNIVGVPGHMSSSMNSPMATLGYGDTSGVAMGLLIRGFEKLNFFKKFFKIFFTL